MNHATEQPLPWNLDAEQAVLGSLLIDPDCYYEVQPLLRASDFYRSAHRTIYEAIERLHTANVAIDPVALVDELQRGNHLAAVGGWSAIAALGSHTPTAIHATHYATIVSRLAHARRVREAAEHAARYVMEHLEEDADAISAEVEGMVLAATQDKRTDGGAASISSTLESTVQAVWRAAEGKARRVPCATQGLHTLLGGYQPGQLVVWAGRPGAGKTSKLIHTSTVAAGRGHHVMVFELEMSKQELDIKILAAETGIDSHAIRDGRLSPDEMDAVNEAAGELAARLGEYLWVDDTPQLSWADIYTRAKRRKLQLARQGETLDLIVIDYLQIMRHTARSGLNYAAVIGETTAGLKRIAKELGCVVMVGSQLSRSSDKDGREPQLFDLRDSGAIEADADIVAFPYVSDPQHAPERVTLLIRKHRQGATGRRDVIFDRATNRWHDVALPHQAPPPWQQDAALSGAW